MDTQCTLCDANIEFLIVLSQVLFLERARDIFPFSEKPKPVLEPTQPHFHCFSKAVFP
jgi:hypothetical protein